MSTTKLTPNQKEKLAAYKQVNEILSDINWQPGEEKTDAHLFFALIEDDKGLIDQEGNMSGSESGMIQIFIQVLADRDCPVMLKKTLLIAATHIVGDAALASGDADAEIVCKGLALWTKKNFGHVYCNCPECQGKNFHQN